MAKGRKSKTMTPYTPRKRKGGAKKKRNGMQKMVAMKDAVIKMTKRGYGR